ncbi:MAG: bifunctional ornithine acetyltransferase/N-acetylglutamate synthase [Rhizobiales bacterium NRL2]|jgi:glutamate N-acetyltransferase/amino-acid N-acetyltransferase|nr:MAG: bifunctional ornithine acetyltransferase/N-acetylglutamate synthase [Rhizobiales bacterium NRL2]
MPLPVSPLAPEKQPELPSIAGCRCGAIAAGLRYKGRNDLTMLAFAPGTTVAGVQTTSTTAGAPVVWNAKRLPGGTARAVIVNAGNANVFNGERGERDVAATAAAVAEALGCAAEEVLVASTGVIGEPMPIDRLCAAVPELAGHVRDDGWPEVAAGIMTTDTFEKRATARVAIDGVEVTINGVAKGSGMIAPNMATMLSYVVTDARLPAAVLRDLLGPIADRTFNCVTVDSDMSTSDMCLLFATGMGPAHRVVERTDDPALADFARVLEDVLRDLAIQVARDGEGAQKLITIDVTGAEDDRAARAVALAIGNSPLVKTAIAGEDANWGRIVMAIGKSGERAERNRLRVRVGGVTIAEDGSRRPDYKEADLGDHMKGRDIRIEVDLGLGDGLARVWTCDLTHGYIDINADYRS